MTATADVPSGQDPLLLPDRDEPYRLRAAYELVQDGCRTEIVLDWGGSCLAFRADADTDEIRVRFQRAEFQPQPAHRDISASPPWDRYVGKECGWSWLAVNQQGYWDSALLSFDGIVPNVLFNVMASSVYCAAIGPLG